MEKLTQAQKQILANCILKMDPAGEIATLFPNQTFTAGSISYNTKSGIVLNEKITKLTDEEYVRAYLVVRLVKQLDYPSGSLELEKGYTIGRPTGKSAQLDVRVADKRGKKAKTFMLIEAKRPDDFESYTELIEDQLFAPGNMEAKSGVRYLAWYTVEFVGEDFRDKCIVIDFDKCDNYKAWVEAGEIGHNLELPKEYGAVRKQRYLRSQLFQFQIQRDWSGSAQPEIYPDELAVMRIAAITKAKQDELGARISVLEGQITGARANVKPPADIINEILCKAFRYPLTEHRERERERQFARDFSRFADSYSLRGSVKFHHPDYELTDAFFAGTSHKRVKDFLALPIRLGVSLTREVMSDAGEAFYVHPSATRHEEQIDTGDCHGITEAYYEANKRRAGLRIGDLLINRSGEHSQSAIMVADAHRPFAFAVGTESERGMPGILLPEGEVFPRQLLDLSRQAVKPHPELRSRFRLHRAVVSTCRTAWLGWLPSRENRACQRRHRH